MELRSLIGKLQSPSFRTVVAIAQHADSGMTVERLMIFKNLIRYCKPHVAQQFYGAFGKLIQEAVDLGAERFEVIGPAMQVGHVLAQFAPEFFNGVAPRGISG